MLRRLSVVSVVSALATTVVAGIAGPSLAATAASHRPGAVAPVAVAPVAAASSTRPVVMFSSDGMRPDLMQKYAAKGEMPHYRAMMKTGATGDNGLTQGFPPNTGQGWYTLATGAYPGVHGSTNNTFYDTRQAFTSSTSFSFHGNGASPGSDPTDVLEAQSVASSAEQSGKKVAQLEWTGGLNANINGPTVDYATFFSQRGVLETPLNTTKQQSAAKFGLSYQVASFADAAGWTNVPGSQLPAKQSTLQVTSTSSALNPDRTFDLYVYATSASGYDRVLVVPETAGKDGSAALATLVPGQFSALKVTGDDGLIGTDAGETAGFYIKIMKMAPDLSKFSLYFTSLTRPNAHCAHGRVRRAARRRDRRGPPREVHRRQPAAGRSSATSRRRKPASSTRTPGTSRSSGSTRRTTPRCSSTCWARCNPTRTCCSPAPTRPTR